MRFNVSVSIQLVNPDTNRPIRKAIYTKSDYLKGDERIKDLVESGNLCCSEFVVILDPALSAVYLVDYPMRFYIPAECFCAE